MISLRRVWMIALLVIAVMAGCNRASDSGADEGSTSSMLRLTSSAFEDGEMIPSVYTCDGEDISPPLRWDGVPEGTRTLALIMDDPDAPLRTWVHWVVYNIPPDLDALPEAGLSEPGPAQDVRQGENSLSRTGYGGPCPPSGKHHYIFTLYALDTSLDLEPTETDKQDLLDAMQGHVLARTTLTGLYER